MKVGKLYLYQTTDMILRTTELRAGVDREAGVVFECARASDALVDTEAYLLFAVRTVRD